MKRTVLTLATLAAIVLGTTACSMPEENPAMRAFEELTYTDQAAICEAYDADPLSTAAKMAETTGFTAEQVVDALDHECAETDVPVPGLDY